MKKDYNTLPLKTVILLIGKVINQYKAVLARVKMAMVSMNIMMVSMAVLGAVLYMQVIFCQMSKKHSMPCLNCVKTEKIFR